MLSTTIDVAAAVGEPITLACDAMEPGKSAAGHGGQPTIINSTVATVIDHQQQYMLEWMYNDEIIYTRFSASRTGQTTAASRFAG